MTSTDWLVITVIYFVIIIALSIVMVIMKSPYRKYTYLEIKKSIDDENSKLITDKEDLEYIKSIEPKFKKYSQQWYYNNTIVFYVRYKKWKNIVKKYNLNIKIVDYSDKEE